MMPISRYVVFCDLLDEESSESEPPAREATQADIDAFLS